jgi:hypothetical protein
MKITKEQLLAVIRHGLTFLGGFVITKGFIDESLWMELSGTLVTLSGLIWSILEKRNK